MVTKTHIDAIDHGFTYSIEVEREAFYDENDDRVLGPPDRIIGGWAPSRAKAQSEVDDALSEL